MYRLTLLTLLTLLPVGWLVAAPPDAPTAVKAPAGKVKEIAFKTNPGQEIAFRLVGGPAAFREMKGDSPTERVFWLVTETDAPSHIVWWTVGEKGSTVTEINKGGPAPVDPDVNPPEPKPPTPPTPPDVLPPLTSFRVIFVYESADNLTPAQRAVLFGKEVEAYLTVACTEGKKGWRRRDKDAPGEGDPAMAGLWSAVQPKVTVTPCVAIARNDKVEIVNLEPTPALMVAVIKKYRDGVASTTTGGK